MTNELVGRFAATTAQRIAPTAKLARVGVPPVLIESLPPVRNRLGRFVRCWLHAPEPAEHGAHFAHVQSCHRRFGPFKALQRGAIVRFGDLVDVWRTVVIIEHLARLRKQGLDVFPYPFGPIGHHAQPHMPFGNQACVFHLLERLTKFPFVVHLMPTPQMDDAIAIEEIEAKTLGVAPLTAPQRTPGPLPSWTWTMLPRAVGTR